VSLRLLLGTSQTKSLIGKGGAKIQNIRQSSGAQVRILPKWEVPLCGSLKLDTVCQINGALDETRVAVEGICEIIESGCHDDELQQEELLSLWNAQLAGLPMRSSLGALVSFCVLVPAAQAGQLIGRGGEVIRRIREVTGAALRVSAPEEGGDYRCLEIAATETPLQARTASMEALLRCLYCLNAEARPRAYSIRLVVPRRCATTIIGKGGADIQTLRNATRAIIRISETDEGIPKLSFIPAGKLNLVHIEGPALSVHSALESIAAAVRLSAWSKDRRGTNRSPDGDLGGPTETVVMDLTRLQAGAIIGMSGTNINHMREISGAKVTLKGPTEEDNKHKLEIVGTTQQCQAARCMANAFIWKSGSEPEPEKMTGHHAVPVS